MDCELHSLALGADAAEDAAEFMQLANQDSDEEADGVKSTGSSRDKGGKKKGEKAKAKAKTVLKGPKQKKNGPSDGWRKCKQCSDWKEEEEFNESQARCKKCYNDGRALRRVAGR